MCVVYRCSYLHWTGYVACDGDCLFEPCIVNTITPGLIVGLVLASLGLAVLLAVVLTFGRQIYMRRKRRLEYTDLEGGVDEEGL